MKEKEKMCRCGDTESQHVDGCEQCVIHECGCKEFEEISCEKCNDSGMIEIMGDGANFEWDVVDMRTCSCQFEE